MTGSIALAACLFGATFTSGVWKSFKYEEDEMTNAPIVFTGWAKAEAREVADFCIWLDIYYKNGEHTYGRCAYFDRTRTDWQQARGVFKPGYPVKRIDVNALFRGNQWNRKGKPDGTCVFRDFTLERRSGTNEAFVVMKYSNRPFENTVAEFTDTLDGERVTRTVRTTPHADAMTSPIPNGCPKVWAANSLRKISPLTFPKGTADEKSLSILMARNERESAQVLVSMPADTEWAACELELPRLRMADGTPFAGEIKWERQGYLAREPGFSPHPCALPDHERWFPEVLLPAAPMRVRACSTQGAWITVYAATNAVPGDYTGDVVVKECGVEKGRVPLRVSVASVALPRRFIMPNAFALMDCHTRRVYGKDWKHFRREAQDIMLDHRLNPDDISRTELPEIDDLLHARERGMNCFNILNVVPKPKKPTDMVLICKPGEVFNEKYYDYFFGKVKPFVEELKRHGLDKDAYVYGFDERGPEFYDGIREFWERMQREIPGIPLMNTAKNYSNYAKGKRKGDESLLMGDWYCPVTWDHDFAVSEEIRRKTGKKVWWYVCCGPLFCAYESNPVERRIFGLQTWQVKADGFLYWMMNYWLTKTRLSEGDTYFPAYKTGHWAGNAGGGMLLFPGESHVLPTIRLAQIRDGMEDYEFAVLHDRIYGRDATMKIVERVSQFPGTGNLPGKEGPYDADPSTLLGVRGDLLKGIAGGDSGEWVEKFYPGLEAGGKVNFLEKGYLGKEPAIELVYASGLAKFGVARDVTTELKGVVDWTVSAHINGAGGSVAAAMEFFDAKGESLKLDTGRSYGPKAGVVGKENWDLATWRFTSPRKAVRASVHLLSTGKAPVRFAKVVVKSAQGVDTDEMPFDVEAWPVAWNPDWHGGEPDMVNFSDAPIPVTFALFGDQDEVKEPVFEIVMPEGLEIRDAFCANYHEYGREEPASASPETFAGVPCLRYRFTNPIAARCLKPRRDLDRLYGITMVIAPKGGVPERGDYVIGYRVACNGKKGLERTFKMKYQPLPKGLRRAPNFQVFTWTDQDRNFSRDGVYASSMKAFAAAGLTTKHRNGIYRPNRSYDQAQCASARASEIADRIKRDYPEAIISYELQDLWRPFNCRLTPELEKEVAAHMSKAIDAAQMHAGNICPSYFATSKKLHDHLRDNVIVADMKRFNVQDGDWVELDMEPWECQTWCFCDDCLKAFAAFHKLDHVPTIEEAKADPDKWADFRTAQSMESTKLLAEMIHEYNPKLLVVDYDYILDYGNEEAEKKFRRACAKDAFKNEKWLDGHLASYYHTIGKPAFDAIRNNVRYLKKPYYPMGGLIGYGSYLRPGEVLDDKQFRQLGLAALVNGCPGWAFYNGTCFDGRQIVAMMRVQDDAARYGHLPWGKVDGKSVPTCGNPLFAYASTVDADGQETVALFNYDRNEAITVRLNDRDYVVEPSDVLFVALPMAAAEHDASVG